MGIWTRATFRYVSPEASIALTTLSICTKMPINTTGLLCFCSVMFDFTPSLFSLQILTIVTELTAVKARVAMDLRTTRANAQTTTMVHTANVSY